MKDSTSHGSSSSSRANDAQDDPKREGQDPNAPFTQAVNRLEAAVQELVGVTAGQLSDRASSLIEDTTKRLEAELRFRKVADEDDMREMSRRDKRRRSRHRYRRRFAHQYSEPDGDEENYAVPRHSGLYIDRNDEKIAGVCAAIARYFGFQKWTVRLAAVSGLIFIPHVVFPAYWVSYFVMDKEGGSGKRKRGKRSRRRDRRRAQKAQMYAASGSETRHNTDSNSRGNSVNDNEGSQQYQDAKLNEELSPKRHLRYTQADLAQAELRLRRLESFVTSDQYELHREITKIEREGQSSAQ